MPKNQKSPQEPDRVPVRQFRGVWIPKIIWESKALSWAEKCLLAEVDSLDDGTGCFASNAYLAKAMGTTPGAMAVAISKLRKQGHILDRKSDGRNRWISVSYAPESREMQAALLGQTGTSAKEAAISPSLTQPLAPANSSLKPQLIAHIQGDTTIDSTGENTTTGKPVPVVPTGESQGPKKSKPEPSEEGRRFAAWFRTLLPSDHRLEGQWERNWGVAWDEMIRLDGRTKEEIPKVCAWARKDEFWKANLLSPVALRQRNAAKVMKYDSILEKMRQVGALKNAPKAAADPSAPSGAKSEFEPAAPGHRFSIRKNQKQTTTPPNEQPTAQPEPAAPETPGPDNAEPKFQAF